MTNKNFSNSIALLEEKLKEIDEDIHKINKQETLGKCDLANLTVLLSFRDGMKAAIHLLQEASVDKEKH